MEQTAESGLLAKSISAASRSFSSSKRRMTSGMGVETGQCLRHWGTLHFRQREEISCSMDGILKDLVGSS
jgi:hypothetical protein